MVLVALGWLLISHESKVETVLRSDGKPVTVRTCWVWWAAWLRPRIALTGGHEVGDARFIGSLIVITDDHGTYTWWSPKWEELSLIADVDGGYALSTTSSSDAAPYDALIETRGYWLGPHGERTPGLPGSLPLRRCVQNLSLTNADRDALAHFDPEQSAARASLTARLWWKMRNGRDVAVVPVDFIKEIIQTEFGGARDLTKAQHSPQPPPPPQPPPKP